MKKYISYIIIAAAAIFAASCAEENIGQDLSDAIVTLRLQTARMETRATVSETGNTVDGEGVENTLTHADFFFFADTEGNNLLNHVRLAVGEDASSSLVAKGDNIYEHKFDVSDEGNPLQNASYVYILANYPSEISATTLSEILDLDINIDLSESVTAFVMDSYDSATEGRLTYLSPSKVADSKEFTIGLKRAAAKLVLDFNVYNEIKDGAGNVWTPVTDEMWANFVNARKAGKVAAEPVEFDEKVNYFTTSQATPTSMTSSDPDAYTSWTIPAVYTYPQQYKTEDVTAPYYKIFIPWVCEKKGQNNFYYKIVLPDLGSFKRNKIYKLTVDVSVIGGTEDDWALVTDHIYVADWWAPETIESSVEGAMYLDVPGTKIRENNIDYVYYEIYGIDYIDVPVASSNDIEVVNVSGEVNVTGTKKNLYDDSFVPVTPTISYADDGKSSFRLTHVLNNDITSSNFDCTPITYTMTVRHKSGGLSKTVNVEIVQYPSIYAEADASNGYAYVNSYTRSGSNRGGRQQQSGSTYYAYNNLGTSSSANRLGTLNSGVNETNSNYNQYVVTTTVLPNGYKINGLDQDILIGDPRGGSLYYNNLGFSAYGNSGTRVDDVQKKYNAVSSLTQNVIAPSIRIASSWGASVAITNFDRAEERCASYQENGYPAGRWRLPTIAEIDFLIQLSDNKHIPALFTVYTSNGYVQSGYFSQNVTLYRGYWAGGRYLYTGNAYVSAGYSSPFVQVPSDAETQTVNYDSSSTASVVVNDEYIRSNIRCVYDEWYWGSNKYDSNGNMITEIGNPATRWIGYIY